MGNVIRKRSRVRKLVHSPILVYYQLREEKRAVEVLHFRHGSRKPPKF
jgi:plasmid stabilization system protein ParE